MYLNVGIFMRTYTICSLNADWMAGLVYSHLDWQISAPTEPTLVGHMSTLV